MSESSFVAPPFPLQLASVGYSATRVPREDCVSDRMIRSNDRLAA